RIVSDLLAFSRRSKPQRALADLNKIARTTLSLISHKLKLANVSVREEFAADLPPVFCDSAQMQQVVLNLLLNAADAMRGRESGEILVRTEFCATAGAVALSVTDKGEGI